MNATLLLTMLVMLSPLSAKPAFAVKDNAVKTEAQEGKEKTKDTMVSVKSYSVEKKDEAMKKAQEALDDLDARIDMLQKDMEKQRQKWSKKITQKKEEELGELKKMRAELAKHYEEFKAASGEAWEKTKDAFVNGYQKVEKALSKLRKEVS
jgi:thiamine biosynthesis lipoprotein ApbE